MVIIIIETIGYYWKWALLIAYLAVAYAVWEKKNILFDVIPINEKFLLYSHVRIIENILLVLIGIVFLIGIIQFMRTPVLLNFTYKRRFSKFNFTNSVGEYPRLLSRKKDRNKKHGVIYTFDNNGLSILDFEKYITQLDIALRGHIYEINYGKKDIKKIMLYVLPKKYDTPNIIAFNSDYMTCNMINLLCVGRTESGKSYALLVILGSLVEYKPDISFTICDYKKASFSQFADTKNFYGYEDVPSGIRTFYKEFTERLEANDEQRNKQKRVLLIDEYGALIAAQEKKQADELKTMVANMLFMGRSLGIILLIGVQRADAEHFKAGARDQFKSILALGNLSKEQKNMLFSDYKDKMTANNRTGEGYLLEDGKDIARVKVVRISDFDKLNDNIRRAMNR